MADYSLFPWDTLTRDEIAKLMIHSKEIGDDDFVKACAEQLKHRPTPYAPRPETGVAKSENESNPAVSGG